MTHPQFDQGSSTSAGKLRQQLTRPIQIIRRSDAWVWLLLVFGWYGLHGVTTWPLIEPDGKISIIVLTILMLVGTWTWAWAGWCFWVTWPIPVLATLMAALCLLGFAGMVVGLASPAVKTTPLALVAAIAVVVAWAIRMTILGAGTTRSLKRHFPSDRSFQILASVALVGLGAGAVLRLAVDGPIN
jgi:hypothetical protein